MTNIGPLEDRYMNEAYDDVAYYVAEFIKTHEHFPNSEDVQQIIQTAFRDAYKRQSKNTENNYSLSFEGLYHPALPRNAKNAITEEPIEEGQNMVNFHGESNLGRYYKQNTYYALKEKKNPFTRRNIKAKNVVFYKAKLQGGKRKTRKGRK